MGTQGLQLPSGRDTRALWPSPTWLSCCLSPLPSHQRAIPRAHPHQPHRGNGARGRCPAQPGARACDPHKPVDSLWALWGPSFLAGCSPGRTSEGSQSTMKHHGPRSAYSPRSAHSQRVIRALPPTSRPTPCRSPLRRAAAWGSQALTPLWALGPQLLEGVFPLPGIPCLLRCPSPCLASPCHLVHHGGGRVGSGRATVPPGGLGVWLRSCPVAHLGLSTCLTGHPHFLPGAAGLPPRPAPGCPCSPVVCPRRPPPAAAICGPPWSLCVSSGAAGWEARAICLFASHPPPPRPVPSSHTPEEVRPVGQRADYAP